MTWYIDVTGSYARHGSSGGECQYKIYDEYDNLIEHRYYIYNGKDAGKNKYRLTDYKNLGYAVIEYKYDNIECKSESYRDEKYTQTTNSKTGCATVNYDYTYNGRKKSIEYRDASGNLVDVNIDGEKYARIQYIYDSSGNPRKSVYYNKAGEIVK